MPAVTDLRRLFAGVARGEFLDHILAFGTGILDGVLIDKMPIAYIAKNVVVPVLKAVGMPVPDGVTYESEGQLGFLIYLLLKPEGGE